MLLRGYVTAFGSLFLITTIAAVIFFTVAYNDCSTVRLETRPITMIPQTSIVIEKTLKSDNMTADELAEVMLAGRYNIPLHIVQNRSLYAEIDSTNMNPRDPIVVANNESDYIIYMFRRTVCFVPPVWEWYKNGAFGVFVEPTELRPPNNEWMDTITINSDNSTVYYLLRVEPVMCSKDSTKNHVCRETTECDVHLWSITRGGWNSKKDLPSDQYPNAKFKAMMQRERYTKYNYPSFGDDEKLANEIWDLSLSWLQTPTGLGGYNLRFLHQNVAFADAVFKPWNKMVSFETKDSFSADESPALAGFMHSHCDVDTGRATIASALQRLGVAVSSYAGCTDEMVSKEIKETNGFLSKSSDKLMYRMNFTEYSQSPIYSYLASKHKLWFATENAACQNYISEKMHRPWMIDAIPIVWEDPISSRPHYRDILPTHSYINIADFENIEHLANYLTFVGNNETEWNKYWWFRRNNVRESLRHDWIQKYVVSDDLYRHHIVRMMERLETWTYGNGAGQPKFYSDKNICLSPQYLRQWVSTFVHNNNTQN